MQIIYFSRELYIFVFICLSGNKIFNIEAADRIQIDLFLSSKKRGEIALISSILKYPSLFSPLDFQLTKILFPKETTLPIKWQQKR